MTQIAARDPETFTVTKVGVDATKPDGRDFAERLVISGAQRVRGREILAAAEVRSNLFSVS